MKVCILGMGAYGMALSDIFCNNDCNVSMWTKFESEKNQLEINHRNDKLIPNYKINHNIELTTNMNKCVEKSDLIVIAIPAAFFESVCIELNKFIDINIKILIATKGIEQKSCKFMHEIIENTIHTKNYGVISGPSFAIDIIEKKPIGLTVATENDELFYTVKEAMNRSYIYIERSKDIKGVELCGSTKNIFAIISGIIKGLNATDSTMAMAYTKFANEIRKLLIDFGCNEKTILTHAGIGDLILTCSSEKSRNFKLGYMIGSKKSKEEVTDYIDKTTIEGYYTLESVIKLLKSKNIKFELMILLLDVIKGNIEPEKIINYLVV